MPIRQPVKPSSIPEFMIRVRLPEASAYGPGPSGDTEFEDAFEKALKAATPAGFEPVRPRIGERWPKSDGVTFVPLRLTDPSVPLAILDELAKRIKKLESIQDDVRKAVGK